MTVIFSSYSCTRLLLRIRVDCSTQSRHIVIAHLRALDTRHFTPESRGPIVTQTRTALILQVATKRWGLSCAPIHAYIGTRSAATTKGTIICTTTTAAVFYACAVSCFSHAPLSCHMTGYQCARYAEVGGFAILGVCICCSSRNRYCQACFVDGRGCACAWGCG